MNRLRSITWILLATFACAAPARGQSDPVGEKTITFNFKAASLDQVLATLSQLGGLTVVRDDGVKLEGTVTATNMTGVTVDEAIRFLNSLLKPKDAAAVRMGRIVKVVKRADAKFITQVLRVGSDPTAIPPGDDVVTHIVPLRFASATDLQKELKNMIPKDGDLAANVQSNSLIITGSASAVRRFVQVLHALDNQIPSVTQLKVYPLKNADAEKMAKALQEIFKKGSSRSSDPRSIMRSWWSGRSGSSSGSSSSRSSSASSGGGSAEIRVTADVRTNSLIVSAREDQLQLVDELVNQLDADPTETDSTMVYKLQNANADDLARSISDLLSGRSGARGTSSRSTSSRGTSSRSSSSSPFSGIGGSGGSSRR